MNADTANNLADVAVDHGNGIALVPDRTSAPGWQEFAPRASAVLFVAGKIKFERPDGTVGASPGTGTCVFAAGDLAREILFGSGLGMTVKPGPERERNKNLEMVFETPRHAAIISTACARMKMVQEHIEF